MRRWRIAAGAFALVALALITYRDVLAAPFF
jgi:hypothetical protein